MKTPEKNSSRKFAVLAIGAAVSFLLLAASTAHAGAVSSVVLLHWHRPDLSPFFFFFFFFFFSPFDYANAIPMPLPQSPCRPG